MKHYVIYCLLALFISHDMYAQGENNIWAFGYHHGLTFNTNPPTFFSTKCNTGGASASVSDAAGNLLFYSDGDSIWNADHNAMPNGDILTNDSVIWPSWPGPGYDTFYSYSTQGVYIVQCPGNTQQYYLFTVQSGLIYDAITRPCTLRYSLIDMTLDGGKGAVVTNQKNLPVDTGISESMVVIKGAGCYYWLLTQRRNDYHFRAYKIDNTGIHLPVISPALNTAFYYPISGSSVFFGSPSYLAASPDGSMIASTSFDSEAGGIEIASFNNITGMVNNNITIEPGELVLTALCFSPDNSKLYSGQLLKQYNLNAFPNAAAIQASEVALDTIGNYPIQGMRSSPDGRIYVIYDGPYNHQVCIIDNPDQPGQACNYTYYPLPVSQYTLAYNFYWGNNPATGLHSDTISNRLDTLICSAEQFLIPLPAGFQSYVWNDGSAAGAKTLSADGLYWRKSISDCHVRFDTFNLRFERLSAFIGPDTTICPSDSFTINLSQPGASYLWSDNSTADTFLVRGQGLYYVTIHRNDCTLTDTIYVAGVDPTPHILEGDTAICKGSAITLHTRVYVPGSYFWNTESTAPEIRVSQQGIYQVHTSNICGVFSDQVIVNVNSCVCDPFIPNAFSPNQDGANDFFLPVIGCNIRTFSMKIFNRYGQLIFESQSQDKGWDGTYQGQPASGDTYYYDIRYYTPDMDVFHKKGDLTLLR